MVLEIVTYGHPALRAKGKPIEAVDEHIRQVAQDMLETMAAAQGVGLAAQQVGLPLQLFVIDIRGVENRPSAMWVNGRRTNPEADMPMVLLNPEIETMGKGEAGPEGCLSFPGVQGDIVRPARVRLRATGLDGEAIAFEAEGLLARAIQHEYDHVQGILFIDRMAPSLRQKLRPEIEAVFEGTRRATQGPLVR